MARRHLLQTPSPLELLDDPRFEEQAAFCVRLLALTALCVRLLALTALCVRLLALTALCVRLLALTALCVRLLALTALCVCLLNIWLMRLQPFNELEWDLQEGHCDMTPYPISLLLTDS